MPELSRTETGEMDWIEWKGGEWRSGECPVPPYQQIEWRARDGLTGVAVAGDLIWKRSRKPLAVDIVAFRLLPPLPSSHRAAE